MIWRREVFNYQGQTVHVPLPEGQGTGMGRPLKLINHPLRSEIPIWWASLKDKSVEATAELADGWLPIMFVPEKYQSVWGSALKAGLAKRSPDRNRLDISAGGMLAIDEKLVGDERMKVLDLGRPNMALYVGGMGARGKNFYNDIARAYGYEREADEVQDLYLAGKKVEAAAALPGEWLELSNLVGPRSYVKERIAAFRDAGVTTLLATPVTADGAEYVEFVEQLQQLLD